MADFLSIYMTASSQAEAERLARALVEGRLAACVNIFPGVRSVYRWEGRVEAAEEVVLIAKSRAETFAALCETVKSLHSYSCPCIVATPIAAGHPAYLDWLAAETTR